MADLTSVDVRTRVLRLFGDEDNSQLTDTDILGWINDAIRQISVANDLGQIRASAATVANQSDYTLPSDLSRLRRVTYQGSALMAMSQEQADELIPGTSQTHTQGYPTGTPAYFWVYSNTLVLYPAPATTGSTDLTIFYLQEPVALNAINTTALPLPSQYHDAVVQYCMKQAYEIDANIQMLNIKSQEFQSTLDRLGGNEDWREQNVYPSISYSPEYDCGLG